MATKKDLENQAIARLVIQDKSKEELIKAKKFIETLKEYKKYSKYYKTYYKGIKKAIDYNKEDRVYVENKLDGTKTGRTSCKAYEAGKNKKGVSFHTLPRPNKIVNIRKLFYNDNGAFLTADYSGMEPRIAAYMSNDKGLLKAFNSGEDPYIYTASLIFNKELKDVKKEERQLAKTVLLLVIYGGSANKLAATANISVQKAAKILERLQAVYPGIFTWVESVHKDIFENKQVVSLFGGIRHLPDIDSKDKYTVFEALRQGVNFKVQRSSSDILAFAAKEVDIELTTRGLISEMKETVHDSMEIDLSLEEIREVVEIVQDKMFNYPSIKKLGIVFTVPLKVEIIIGKSFGDGIEAHFKDNKLSNFEEIKNYLESK